MGETGRSVRGASVGTAAGSMVVTLLIRLRAMAGKLFW